MKQMKKALCLLLALAAALLLTGCHSANEVAAFGIPAELDATREFELTFWAKNDNNQTQTAIYRQAVDAFEALYPNIHIELRLYPDYGRIYNDVITNIATGTTPNVCITYPDHIATYLTGNNVVTPLDSLFTDARYGLGGSELRFDGPTVDEIVPKFLEECRIGAHYYAIPYMRSTEACYVNKTLVEALGYTLPEKLTWDFVWEVSEAAMAKDADGVFLVNGQKVMIPFIYKSTDNMMIQLLRQAGGGYSTSEGDILIFNDTTKNLLLDISQHARTRAFSTFGISSYPGNFLNAGQCIFAIDSTAGATWMGHTAPHLDISEEEMVDFELVVMAIPQFDTEHPQMISQGPSVCVFNKEDPQEVLASWLFAQYLLTNDVQMAYAETEGYLPVTLKTQQDPAYQDYLARCGEDNDEHYSVKIEASLLLMENIENTFVTPVFNGSASLRDAAGEMIEEVCKSARRNKEVSGETIDALYAQMVKKHHLGQEELGPLPGTAVTLLAALAAVWGLIGLYALRRALRAKKRQG